MAREKASELVGEAEALFKLGDIDKADELFTEAGQIAASVFGTEFIQHRVENGQVLIANVRAEQRIAATMIQAKQKGKAQRNKMKLWLRCGIKIQRQWRAHFRSKSAAIKIQQYWRSKSARLLYQAMVQAAAEEKWRRRREAAIKIQSFQRGRGPRRELFVLRQAKRLADYAANAEALAISTTAALKFQRIWRGMASRRRTEFLRMARDKERALREAQAQREEECRRRARICAAKRGPCGATQAKEVAEALWNRNRQEDAEECEQIIRRFNPNPNPNPNPNWRNASR